MMSGLLAKSGRSLGVINSESFCFKAFRRSVNIEAAKTVGLQSSSLRNLNYLTRQDLKTSVSYLLGSDGIQADFCPCRCGWFLWIQNLTSSFVLLK